MVRGFMVRSYHMAEYVLSSVGITLLICGLILVPQHRPLLADDGTIITVGLGYGCAGDECNLICTAQAAPCTGTQAPFNNHGRGARVVIPVNAK
jgi:hypothetical protein